MTETKELQVKEKQGVAEATEQTRPGVVFTPEVDIFENDQEITLLADMPGVAPEDVTIDLEEGVLSISGIVKPLAEKEESDVLIEFEIGRYYRRFTLSDVIDQSKINASLKNGVLRLTLPKAAKAIPRQIEVIAG